MATPIIDSVDQEELVYAKIPWWKLLLKRKLRLKSRTPMPEVNFLLSIDLAKHLVRRAFYLPHIDWHSHPLWRQFNVCRAGTFFFISIECPSLDMQYKVMALLWILKIITFLHCGWTFNRMVKEKVHRWKNRLEVSGRVRLSQCYHYSDWL
mgnify:CR=1 FL=1